MTTGIPRIASLILVVAALSGCQTTKATTDGAKQTVDATNRTGPKDEKTFAVASVGGTGPDVDFAAAVAAIASDPSSGVRQVGGPSVVPSAQTRIAAAPAPTPTAVAYSAPPQNVAAQIRQAAAQPVAPLVAAPVPAVTTVSAPRVAVVAPVQPVSTIQSVMQEPEPEPRRIRRF